MKDINQIKRDKRAVRHHRVRIKISGSAEKPRLSVFRANQNIYAQLIDDVSGKTLASASSLEINLPAGKAGKKDKKTNVAAEVGRLLAGKAKEKKIEGVVFDRGGFAYHGRVKALAEGAREGGLKF